MVPEEAPVVVETPGGLSVSYRGRLLYSSRDPARLPRRLAEACDPGPARLHIVASPLLWYGVDELLARMGEGSRLLCVEADPALAELSLRRAPAGLLERPELAFIATDSPEALVEAARRLGRFRASGLVALSGGEALHDQLYRRMASLAAADIEASWRNRAALLGMGRLWARNIFENAAALPGVAPAPLPCLAGPVAVCGAGPSLEEALPLLARNRGRLGIVACDTALGSLLASGIEPDLVVCLEAQAHNLPDFTCLGDRPIRLVADLSSHPATFRAVRGPKHLTATRIADSPFLARASAFAASAFPGCLPMPPLGSVGVHALALARSLGPGPVLALGLDFSFEAGKTHARGSPSLLAEERRLSRITRWPSQYAVAFRQRTKPAPCPALGDGRPLLSDPILLSYASILAEVASSPGPLVLDARGRGPSIGARRIGLDGVEGLIAASPVAGAVSPAPPARVADAAAVRAAARGFLAGEAARLDALYDIMKGRPGARAGEGGRLVAECDYLYWHFADAERAAVLPQDFLNRLLPEVEWWSRRLARLLASL